MITCTLCGSVSPLGTYRGRLKAQCQDCGSLRRHRRQGDWLSSLQLEGPVLHVAPEPCISPMLRALGDYVSMDIRPGVAETVGDLRRMKFPDSYFGLVMVSHVLEHIVEADLAIQEIARVLQSGGHAMLDVPTTPGRATRQVPRDALDHVWEPGDDWIEKYEGVGMEVLLSHPTGTALCRRRS